MKMKKKGKVYPSPQTQPSSSSSSHHLDEDASLSVLKLLPATILVLVTVLSVEDREVLAYLITRGTTISARGNCGSSSVDSKNKKKKTKSGKNHKPPVFDCECFDCYTNYWFRWDSSPNRELIHEIIEAFENHHLTNGENSASRNKSKGGKKKEKPGRRVGCDNKDNNKPDVVEEVETAVCESHDVSSPDRLSEGEVAEREAEDEIVEEEVEESKVVFPATAHKGLARKVLPDVLGLFNSNFWRLWNPNA